MDYAAYKMLKIIQRKCEWKRINLVLCYVRSEKNPADLPSRVWLNGKATNAQHKPKSLNRASFQHFNERATCIRGCFRLA